MDQRSEVHVAILLASYNGERHIEEQIQSLTENSTAFTLHWLDDQSSDRTREIVRSVAKGSRITLREWHQHERQGVPGSFFQLLECVEADVYLFCDQDDIWQPGKIDATVASLLPDLGAPVLCFTDPLLFKDGQPEKKYRTLMLQGASVDVALQPSRLFMPACVYGMTQGFTRALRDLYMQHREIAREYALAHDVWMYDIAVAAGLARLLPDAPTTLYRWHGANLTKDYGTWPNGGAPRFITTRRQHQVLRRAVSRNAEGFILASQRLPQTPQLQSLLPVAHLVANIRFRQSPTALLRLARHRALWPSPRMALGLAAACLLSDAIH